MGGSFERISSRLIHASCCDITPHINKDTNLIHTSCYNVKLNTNKEASKFVIAYFTFIVLLLFYFSIYVDFHRI